MSIVVLVLMWLSGTVQASLYVSTNYTMIYPFTISVSISNSNYVDSVMLCTVYLRTRLQFDEPPQDGATEPDGHRAPLHVLMVVCTLGFDIWTEPTKIPVLEILEIWRS